MPKKMYSLITGASEGLGKAFALECAKRNMNLVLVALPHSRLDELADFIRRNYSVSVHVFEKDLADPVACHELFFEVQKQQLHLQMLINNAGISMRSLFDDVNTDVIRKLMDVNFMGVVYCTKAALPYILERKGTIVGVSSTAGYRGLPGRSGYSASKFALQGWLESLRTELVDSGVHVMWVSPGFTASNIRNAALNSHGEGQGESPLDESKLMSAETCAKYILNAIEKRKRVQVLTFAGKLTVFINKFFPSLADKLVYQHYFKNGELIK
jgi:short-subunit dehydrogenase